MRARPHRKGQDTVRPEPPREEGKFPRGFPPEHGDIAKEANETPEGSTGTNGRRAVSQGPQEKTRKTSKVGPEISFTDEVRPTSVKEISGPTLDEAEGSITQEESGTDEEQEESHGEEDFEDLETPAGRALATTQLISWIRKVMPQTMQGEEVEERLSNLVADALEDSTALGIQAAIKYGKTPDGQDYQVPAEMLAEDEAALSKGFKRAARERLRELDKDATKGRLNPERVWKWVSPENPDFERVLDMATNGVQIPTPPGFVPNVSENGPGIPTPNPQNHKVGAALRKMIVKGFREPRLCFVTTEATARRLVPCFHCSPAVWAPKDGKDSGRNCNNCSYCRQGNTAMNGEWLKERAKEKWNKIAHPTLEDLVDMIVTFSAAAVRNGLGDTRIRLWKMDLKGAYTLVSYSVEDVHLMACSVPEDLVVFFLCGTFGWGGTPYAFQVITRVLVWELNSPLATAGKRLKGTALMYVDDLAGVTFQDDVTEDLATAHALIEGLLGTHTGSTTKERGRKSSTD